MVIIGIFSFDKIATLRKQQVECLSRIQLLNVEAEILLESVTNLDAETQKLIKQHDTEKKIISPEEGNDVHLKFEELKKERNQFKIKEQEVKNAKYELDVAISDFGLCRKGTFIILLVCLSWTTSGFYCWQTKVQRFQDKILENEASHILKKPSH